MSATGAPYFVMVEFMKHPKALTAQEVTKEIIDPAAYLKLKKSEQAKIKSARIVPARLGGRDFGAIEVEYSSPEYRVL